MDRRVIIIAIALMAPFGFASGGEEECDNFVAPIHAIDDGHKHWHHMMPAGGHFHGETWHEEGHMHMDHHSECNQMGMERVDFADASPLQKLSLEDAVVGYTPSIIHGDEAFAFETSKQQAHLNLVSDNVLAAMGFPGSGTEEDPYIVEGYHIAERLNLANTDACVVIRNNLVSGSFLTGPMVDPADITEIAGELADARIALQAANEAVTEANAVVAAANAAHQDARAIWNEFAEGRTPFITDVRAAQMEVSIARAAYDEANNARLENRDEYKALKAELQSLTGKSLPDAPQLGITVAEYSEPDWSDLADEAEARFAAWQDATDDRQNALVALNAAKAARAIERDELLQYDEGKAAAQAPMLATRPILDAAIAERAPLRAEQAEARAARDLWRDLSRQGSILWEGTPFADIAAIVDSVLAEVEAPVMEDAQLIMDWNGQCVHTYNNIVDDLRVNQNNARTGYATGGIIEDNRIFDVGQLRHYDGIFRENEVGNYDQLQAFQSGNTIAADRAANVDGFNQGMLLDNTFYGFVDLDFHGHHHGTGFFAPHSHYHGNDPAKGMHHDHTERWTSVDFAGNTVIDPAKYGLRYEDRNHAGDDRTANSETKQSLNRPHVHRSNINIDDNLIVGSIFVDEFNADGIEVWSDDLTEVNRDLQGRITDVLLHLGAEVVNTHRARNDGWLTLSDNVILHPDNGFAAIDVLDVKEADITVQSNSARNIGTGSAPGGGDISSWYPEWDGEQSAATALLMRDLRDSEASICGNSFTGFTQGFRATMTIMEDVMIRTCPNNNFGGDVDVVFTAYADQEANLLDPVREATDSTAAEPAVDVVADEVDLRDDAIIQQL